MTWIRHHRESEVHASEAEACARLGKREDAQALYALSAVAEERALGELDPSKARTYGITAVSAASLYFKAGQLDRAERVAVASMTFDRLPAFARHQLRHILQVVRADQRRQASGPTMVPIARVVVDGRTWCKGQRDNVMEARKILLAALTSCALPSRAQFMVTPGGFIRIPFQFGDIRGGWGSEHHFERLKAPGAEAVQRLLTEEVLHHLRDRVKWLTIGVDLNNTDEKFSVTTHAELVAVVDVESGGVAHWTGKSYPTTGVNDQSRTLVQAPLESHCFACGRDRVLVLGCHDLHMFSCRGRRSASGCTHKECRSAAMLELAHEFEPRIVLHHPHTTYSPKVWQSAWGALRKRLGTVDSWASGIAFCGKPDCPTKWRMDQTIERTCAATKSEGVVDVTVGGFECHVETKWKTWARS